MKISGALLVSLMLAADYGASQANHPPNAVFKANPEPDARGIIGGPSPLDVTFNMCQSTDPG